MSCNKKEENILETIKKEVVWKEDGRYLIYFSAGAAGRADEAAANREKNPRST